VAVDLPIFQPKETKKEEIELVDLSSATLATALEDVDAPVFRPKITVVGVGGGGCNAVNKMMEGKLQGVEFLVCNTDAQSLETSICENRCQLGENATGGFGTGSNPEVGRVAAQESVSHVIAKLHGSHMVFITAGLGGGTGTGAAPVIANACRNEGILTVAIVTMPFDFEGKRTRELAQTGLQKLQDQVDTVIVVPNQKLLTTGKRDVPLLDAFDVVNQVLFQGIQGVTDLVVRPGLINTDFADLKRVMQSNSGRGLMGTGEAEGEERGKRAAVAALEHPLLDDVDVSAARRVLVTITSSSNCSMHEIDVISTTIQDRVNPEALIIFGVTIAKEMDQRIRVSVVATDMAESGPSDSFGASSTSSRKRSKRDTFRASSSSSSANNTESNGGFFRGWF
jgi:cell division protein FtsZ